MSGYLRTKEAGGLPDGLLTRWRPVTEAPVSGGKRLVVTVATGKAQPLLALTLPAMRQYAAKVGADFLALTNVTQEWPLAEKFRIAHFAARWDRTLYLDADVFVRSGAPDIFEAVPAGQVGIFDDVPGLLADGCGVAWLNAELRDIAESQNEAPFLSAVCLNSGVVVSDRADADIWSPPSLPFPLRHCSEQHIVQSRVMRKTIFDLPEAWNYQWRNHKTFAGIGDAKFIHLAGMSQQAPDMIIPFLRALALQP